MTHTNPDTLSRGSYSNSRRVADILRAESVGGTVLLIATVLAVVLANTPASTSTLVCETPLLVRSSPASTTCR